LTSRIQAKAVNLGADVLADAFVFGVGLAIVGFEFNRSSQKEALKVCWLVVCLILA
jgi:hypothetical protein